MHGLTVLVQCPLFKFRLTLTMGEASDPISVKTFGTIILGYYLLFPVPPFTPFID